MSTDPVTVCEHIEEADAQIAALRNETSMPAAREFSLAITALEDARMRFTRGLAMKRDIYNPADLQKEN